MKHQHYSKGTYIYKIHERSNKFFGIIRGSVSIRVRAVPISQAISPNSSFVSNDTIPSQNSSEIKEDAITENDIRYNLEKETKKLCQGMCFGENSLLKNTAHSESVYCYEDTDVFYLEKEHFDHYLKRLFLKSSEERKLFLKHKIPILDDYKFYFDEPEFFDKGTMLYNSFQKANAIYVIFQGECALKDSDNIKSESEVIERKEKLTTISIVDKGGIIGLESILHNDNNYESNCMVTRDFTVIYKIPYEKIASLLANEKNGLKEFFLNLYKQESSLIKKNIEKKKAQTLTIRSTFKQQGGYNFFDEIFLNAIKDKKEKVNNISSNTVTNYSTIFNKKKITPFLTNQLQLKMTKPKLNCKLKLSRNIPIKIKNSHPSTECNISKTKTFFNKTYDNYSTSVSSNKSIQSHLKSLSSLSETKNVKQTMYMDTHIRKALRQIKLYKKKSVYNSGYFNMPLIH